jgi:hypothetical protein
MSKTEQQREIETWAAMKIDPIWDHSPTPGPSHEQWMAWNNEHGAVLRMACGLMMQTKSKLADYAGDLERDDEFDEALKMYDHSIDFFRDMAKTIEAAKLRLLVGNAVWLLQKNRGQRKPRLEIISNTPAA